MIRKLSIGFILVLLTILGIVPNKGYMQNFPAELMSGTEELSEADQLFTHDDTRETVYSYQISTWDLPVVPRVEVRNYSHLFPGATNLQTFNRLLLKDRFICQSSPKHPYLLTILDCEPSFGRAKEYYVFALRHLII
ncbi:MAG: hypothetical protein RR346_02745 [Bacteroidales bacterium]